MEAIILPLLRRNTMNEKRFAVEVKLTITDKVTGEEFAVTTQKWADMSLKSVVMVEQALHNAQGELLQMSADEVAG